MANKYYENFTGASGVPSKLTAVTTGAGTVSIVSDHLRVRTGGTGATDMAFAYCVDAIDMTKFTVAYMDVKFSGEVGAYNPNMFGLYDYSGNPVGVTEANRNLYRRMSQEYQISSGGDAFDRIQLYITDGAASTRYNYIKGSHIWQTTYAYTQTDYDVGSYYRFVILVDGVSSPKRMRSLVYGANNAQNAPGGWVLNYDSDWLDIGTSAGEIDPVDNSLWLLLGDPISSHASRIDVIFDVRRLMIAELTSPYIDEIAYSNRSTAAGVNYQYSIMKRINPMPLVSTFWIPFHRQVGADDFTVEVSRGTDEYVKDPYVIHDGTTYWMFTQRDNAGEGEIEVQSLTEPLFGTWSAATTISVPGTGEDKHQFPWVMKYGGTWYMIYGVENDDTTWEIQYRTTTATNPTSGWSSAATLLTAGAATKFDDAGPGAAFMVWHSGTFTGGTWYMMYAGYDGSGNWQTGLAKSTTGILGTYTRVSTDPVFPKVTTATTVNGTQSDIKQITLTSTTGMAAGEIYFNNTDEDKPVEILSVDSSTLVTVAQEMNVIDTQPWENFYADSNHIRFGFISTSGRWVFYETQFKFIDGGEAFGAYVSDSDELDLALCTFEPLSVGDAAIDAVHPHWNKDLASDENSIPIIEFLTEPVEAGASVIGPFPTFL